VTRVQPAAVSAGHGQEGKPEPGIIMNIIRWIRAIIESYKLIKKYGVHGAHDKSVRDLRSLRMEYFKKTGRAWKTDDQQ